MCEYTSEYIEQCYSLGANSGSANREVIHFCRTLKIITLYALCNKNVPSKMFFGRNRK